ncbi:MAG TPA: manganese efflux pump [Clostridia bacterium]|nr:manganese efflux pump [Clostridia bacterium]
MNFLTILVIAGALGTDAFSLAVCMGMGKGKNRHLYLFPLVVALFHILMPLIGLGAGLMLGKVLGQVAGYVGGAVLVLMGLHMFHESLAKQEAGANCPTPSPVTTAARNRILTGLWALVVVAGSVSLDALTAGLSLGALRANLWLTVITFGLVAGAMTLAGLLFGERLGCWLGEKAQLIGGIFLAIIGVTMFF